jgi:hypothetical protein
MKSGKITQLIIVAVANILLVGATQAHWIENLHLVYTVIMTIIFGIACVIAHYNIQKLVTDVNRFSRLLMLTWIVNAIVSYAFDWWILGIMWTFNSFAYLYMWSLVPKKKID